MTHTNPELGTSRGTRTPSRKPTGWIVATTGTAALALAGITAAVFMGFAAPAANATTTVPGAATTISTSHTTSSGSSSESGHSGSGSHSGGTSGGDRHHSSTPSSAQILHWQKNLTTLDYYDGNLDGVMSPEMQQSIRLLQGDAGLPQTGTMDHATQAAMQKMLHTQPSSTGTSASGTNGTGTNGRPDQHAAAGPRGSRTAQLG